MCNSSSKCFRIRHGNPYNVLKDTQLCHYILDKIYIDDNKDIIYHHLVLKSTPVNETHCFDTPSISIARLSLYFRKKEKYVRKKAQTLLIWNPYKYLQNIGFIFIFNRLFLLTLYPTLFYPVKWLTYFVVFLLLLNFYFSTYCTDSFWKFIWKLINNSYPNVRKSMPWKRLLDIGWLSQRLKITHK